MHSVKPMCTQKRADLIRFLLAPFLRIVTVKFKTNRMEISIYPSIILLH